MKRRTKILVGTVALLTVAVLALGAAMSHNGPCPSSALATPGADSMKAVVHRCYGTPEVLQIATIAKPIPGPDDVLIKVRAVSINALDFHIVRGTPYLVRLGEGWGTPNDIRLGADYAGTVDAVGANVTQLRIGDPVYGLSGANRAFAEYVVVRGNGSLEKMPANLTFEQAASVPVAGLTALQAVRDHGKVHAGQKVLINGAAGGVGSFAVQIAKALGADVTAVTSTRNLDLMRSIGADHVIDYTREDFTQSAQRYDVIVDCGGGHSLLDFRRALIPHGIYVLVGDAQMGNWLQPVGKFLAGPMILSRVVSQQFVTFIANPSQSDLRTLRDLIQSGKVRPVIEATYPLDKMGEALAHLETGHARGKIVFTVN
jgi:NADPH:quinone reductase-like Zn-dependent oxidoreductase